MNGGGSERGRHRIWNRLRALSCQHRGPMRGSNSRTVRSWPEPKSALNRLSHPGAPFFFFLIFFFLTFIYLFIFERERESVWVGRRQRERERERERESQAGSALSAQILSCGSIPQTMRSWPDPKSRAWMLNQLSHPGVPKSYCFEEQIL